MSCNAAATKRTRVVSGLVELEGAWWALGRVDEFATAQEFATAYNKHMKLSEEEQVERFDVERGWVRWVPDGDGGRFCPAKGPGPGAFEVWYIPEL